MNEIKKKNLKSTVGPLPLIICKNQLKMNQWTKTRVNYESLRRKHRSKSSLPRSDLGFGNVFLDMTPKHRRQKKN